MEQMEQNAGKSIDITDIQSMMWYNGAKPNQGEMPCHSKEMIISR